MVNWVLLNVLSVDDVLMVSDEVLNLLTEVSTGIVKTRVNEFVNKNINSSDSDMRSAASRLQAAYQRVNDIDDYLKSDEAKDLSSFLASMQYSDVSATTDVATLKKWRDAIIELLAEDENFRESYTGEVRESDTRGYKTAYTAKLDEDNLASVIERIHNAVAASPTQAEAHRAVASSIGRNSNLFKNSRYAVNKPTVMRKAVYKKDKLKGILAGLDFLIPRLEAGQSPIRWRKC